MQQFYSTVQSPSIFGRQFLVDLQYEGLQTVLLDQADLAFEVGALIPSKIFIDTVW